MPLYRIQLKQGKRTVVEYVEGKSVTALLTFFEYITTMKVTEILRVEYSAPEDTIIPIDDFVYDGLFKVFVKNDQRSSKQFIFHNIKKTVNDTELFAKMVECLEVGNLPITSCFSPLRKT